MTYSHLLCFQKTTELKCSTLEREYICSVNIHSRSFHVEELVLELFSNN